MITRLKLTNFKKVEDDTMVFSKGLTAIRGANESTKTTRFHAIVYAFFGARALPLPLAETVTYDKPESSLKVELDFIFEYLTYKIVRSKSGAVISNGTVTANGQAEVTKFVERLFGVNADAATKLMIASQNGLRGALETGEAVALIEKLANIDLIDKFIGKMQDQLPCGNTTNTIAAIAELDELEKPTLNTEDLEPAVEFTKAALVLVESELQALVDSDDIDEGFHRTAIARIVADKQHRERLQSDIANLEKQIEVTPVPPTVDIESLKAKRTVSNANTDRLAAYHDFTGLKPVDNYLDGSYDELNAKLSKEVEILNTTTAKTKSNIAVARAMLITATNCNLCGKDLKDVAEVVGKNKLLNIKIEEETLLENACIGRLADLKKFANELQGYLSADRAARNLYARLHTHLTLDETRYPAKVNWNDTTDLSDLDTTDYTPRIKAAESVWSNYSKAVAVYGERQVYLEAAKDKLAGIAVDETALSVSTEALELKTRISLNIKAKQSEVYSARLAGQQAKHLLDQAVTKFNAEYSQYEKSIASKSILEDSLKAMQSNNALIKKLREVRPIVAARLWAIVLASVSTYFSRIRGEVSVIARTTNSFTANGRSIAGLSGSTLDALGLAIRMALGKTFLPSVNFLLLDEPSAGMDDEREGAMLGLLSTVEYDQVIIVTHSSLADSFATGVINL